MATVLDYGTDPEHSVPMHPFFRNAVKHHDASHQPSPAISLGLDGTPEDSDLESHGDASVTSNSIMDALILMPQSTSAAAEARNGGSWSITEGDDLEHENTRVKRRRVSVKPARLLSETASTANPTRSTWHDQLQEAARKYGTQREEFQAKNSIGPFAQKKEENVSQLPQASSRSNQKAPQLPFDTSSITAEIGPAQPLLHQPLQTDGVMDDPPHKQDKVPPTPKNKTLRSGHGKLAFSPKQSTRRSSRSAKFEQKTGSNGTKKTVNLFKKVEMKNGKFVSSLRLTLPYSAPDSGARIDEILSGRSQKGSAEMPVAQATAILSNSAAVKVTHPFFLAKAAVKALKQQADLKSEASSIALSSEDETYTKPNTKAPKAWKDIVFESKKSCRQTVAPLPPIWPPIVLHHIRPSHGPHPIRSIEVLPSRGPSKSKQHVLQVNTGEDVLYNFSQGLKHNIQTSAVHVPVRKVMSGKALAGMVDSMLEMDGNPKSHSNPVAPLKARIELERSSFDKGMAAGPQIWFHEYAPTCWQTVLQDQSKVLHDWLSNLKVHQVRNGKLQRAMPPTPKKQRRKRKSDEMDDFIADSDDDNRSSANGKNAILLVGPSGSGKTASIFAVAQQQGFEVFEIHPGMRRSARDIQDKVGDMTQNHLVQQSSSLSRESSVSVDDRAVLTSGPLHANQKTMASFMAPAKRGKHQKVSDMKDNKNNKESKTKSQKQSLILFEEVDILFEEDKGFWTHVQWLIRTSKRPVILTCNDIHSVPLDELDLFTILHYNRPDFELAVQHLGYIAAAEGHLLSNEALQNLYLSKGQDLRAAITELNLWCQMTVGSQQGGLDWMLPYDDKCKLNPDGSVTRIVSQDTYISGLDLLPEQFDDREDLIRFAQDSLGISSLDWVKDDIPSNITDPTSVQALTDMLIFSDAKSAMDLFDETTAPIIAGAMKKTNTPTTPLSSSRIEMVGHYLDKLSSTHLTRSTISSAFDPLLDESRIGLPTVPGRKAPSLDNTTSLSIATEVAPYIRCIVSHDQRLEQIRTALHGGPPNGANKRQRRTRAARAALEGGAKGTTRRDKWFPEELDWDAVMKTGNGWPLLQDEDVEPSGLGSVPGSVGQTPTPSSSMATETEVEV